MLWHWKDLVEASKGEPDGDALGGVTGVSIDTRTLVPGDLFVALKDARDGHEFVTAAFKAGASAALVKLDYERKPGDPILLRVEDPLRALEKLGIAARARLSPKARVVAITGSAGKTGTKEMLRVCLATCGKVHASEKSYNNHWGVPLTLARMPEDTEFGVFEIGMNHAGEITPLSKMVRPHVAIITNVLPVHLGQFASVDEIAEAKAEIFAGLEAGGTAVLLRDSPHFARLQTAAKARGARVVSFGAHEDADIRLLGAGYSHASSTIAARVHGRDFDFSLGVPGDHIARNALAVLAAMTAAGAPIDGALEVLATIQAPAGRGAWIELRVADGMATLIDESYNANPASMRAALSVLDRAPYSGRGRHIAVLGDMLELGEQSEKFHVDLASAIMGKRIDLLFAAGPHMRKLCEALPKQLVAMWAPTALELRDHLLAEIRAGDVVMIKGSLGSKMGPLVDALRSQFGPGGRIGGNT